MENQSVLDLTVENIISMYNEEPKSKKDEIFNVLCEAQRWDSIVSLILKKWIPTTLLEKHAHEELLFPNDQVKFLFDILASKNVIVEKFEETPVFRKNISNSFIYALDYSPDGRYFAVCGYDKKLSVYSVETHEVVFTETYIKAIGLNFSPDSKLLVLGGYEKTFYVIEVDTWSTVTVVRDTCKDIKDIWFSPDGQLLSFGMESGWIGIYNVDGTKIHEFRPYSSYVKTVRISPDMQYFAAVCNEGKSTLFSLEDYGIIHSWDHGNSNQIWAGNFSHNGKFWLTGDSHGVIRVFDVISGEKLYEYHIYNENKSIWSIALSFDDSIIYSCCKDKSFTIVRLNTGEILQRIETNTELYIMSLNHQGTRLLCSGNNVADIYEYVGKDIALKHNKNIFELFVENCCEISRYFVENYNSGVLSVLLDDMFAAKNTKLIRILVANGLWADPLEYPFVMNNAFDLYQINLNSGGNLTMFDLEEDSSDDD
eukprot:TRINITY_DN1261_c0_g1_i1.p1 TRINITY_DN1261_c0_g1~~TRINITY_DN1261_c0_g1_i1.p1  ORF type:complete len:493 (+),score=109.35 TRINITY_DN1261_c0_g1_i1:35-1480(+)